MKLKSFYEITPIGNVFPFFLFICLATIVVMLAVIPLSGCIIVLGSIFMCTVAQNLFGFFSCF